MVENIAIKFQYIILQVTILAFEFYLPSLLPICWRQVFTKFKLGLTFFVVILQHVSPDACTSKAQVKVVFLLSLSMGLYPRRLGICSQHKRLNKHKKSPCSKHHTNLPT